MQLESKKLIEDVRLACEHILEFTKDKALNDYTCNDLLRSGVERQFEIIGEALYRLTKVAPEVVNQISYHRRVISFRNILIHGYDIVEDPVVWDVITNDLPELYEQIKTMLSRRKSTEP